MGRSSRLLLALWLALTPCAVHADNAWLTLYHDVVGPGRTLINDLGSNLVYYKTFDSLGLSKNQGETTLKMPQGKVRVHQVANDSLIEYSDYTARISSTAGQFKAQFGDSCFAATSDRNHHTVTTPDDEVSFYQQFGDLEIRGRRGTVLIRRTQSGQHISSPAGTTELTFAPTSNGYEVQGVPISAHPYLVRGLLIERGGVGVFCDLRAIYSYVGLVPDHWDALWTYQLPAPQTPVEVVDK
jgi:hypothetical protein